MRSRAIGLDVTLLRAIHRIVLSTGQLLYPSYWNLGGLSSPRGIGSWPREVSPGDSVRHNQASASSYGKGQYTFNCSIKHPSPSDALLPVLAYVLGDDSFMCWGQKAFGDILLAP